MGRFDKITTALLVAASALAATSANAATITTLFNTGVDATGAATTGNGADLHWSLAGGTAYTGGTNGVFPIGPWIGESATSRWITPTGSASDNVAAGNYTYSTTFSLAGLDAGTALLSGRFAADDQVNSIKLNGNLISGSGGGFTQFTAFSAGSGAFVQGLNTLTFETNNGGGPAGLRVEVSGTADAIGAVPEPATWALMIGGFGTIGGTMRRRKTASLRLA